VKLLLMKLLASKELLALLTIEMVELAVVELLVQVLLGLFVLVDISVMPLATSLVSQVLSRTT
jgi:hypothetical protein